MTGRSWSRRVSVRRGLLLVIPLLLGLLLWLLLGWQPQGQPSGAVGSQHGVLQLAAPPTGGDFRLASATGPVALSDFRGQVVLLYFGYTACPDICPTNLYVIAQALQRLAPGELERVQVLFVSVDPERDTPERLAQYTAYFHPKVMGLTAAPDVLAEVAKRYGAAYQRAAAGDSAMGYLIDHSAFTYVIDPAGQLARTLDHATPPETIVATLRAYLPSASAATSTRDAE